MNNTSKSIIKRKRGRPRKNIEKEIQHNRIKKNEKKKDENIVLFLSLSDNESNKSEDENRFTVHDTETANKIVDSISDSDENDSMSEFNIDNKHLNVKMLIDEIKKRDKIIINLRNKLGGNGDNCTANKPLTINYHCVQLSNVDKNNKFIPKETEYDCWWCDESFDNIPAYLVNNYKNGVYYIFGNFCSFNCALKYNSKMLNDNKTATRYALTNNLRIKVTGINTPIKMAGDRELLKSKGGLYTIEKFREGFNCISSQLRINMPPLIPLLHVIEEDRRDL